MAGQDPGLARSARQRGLHLPAASSSPSLAAGGMRPVYGIQSKMPGYQPGTLTTVHGTSDNIDYWKQTARIVSDNTLLCYR